jgi:protein O-GlcNAc transferase
LQGRGFQTTQAPPGRNDPCHCGSGKKYKRCCGVLSSKDSGNGRVSVATAFQAAREYHRAGRLRQAEERYRQVLQVEPGNADALHYLGVMASQMGKNESSVELMRKSIEADPSNALYYNNLGKVLNEQGKLDEAIASCNKALSLKPDYAMAHNNLGNALREQRNLDQAIASYCQALSFAPDFPEALNNLGVALKEQGKLDEAVASFRKAISVKADYAMAHNNLGVALKEQGRLDESADSHRKALSFKPDYAQAYSNLLFLYAYHGLCDSQQYFSEARRWEQACVPTRDREAARSRHMQRSPLSGRRLRVGYVSGDYRQHAVSYFVERLFSHHDRTQIEIFAYSNNAREDAITARIQTLSDHWLRLVGMSDSGVRERIDADGIDVLVDLSGHTAHHRLGVFARRAAPVQAHYLGFFASTGLTEMDYWIGDEILTPAAFDGHFSEEVWRLPRTWVSYDGKADAPLPEWQPARDGTIWVGSFNALGKLTPSTLSLWARVLNALPEARLLLKTRHLSDAGNRERIFDAMSAHGIAADRIELHDSAITPDWRSHMAYYNKLDIALDPIGGLGGATTTCDALWMAVPVVTLIGDRMASRTSASMVTALGKPEWIAQTEAEYIDKVVMLARAVDDRRKVRAMQRRHMAQSPLCDARDLASNLENAYREMFERWAQRSNTH